MKTIRTFSAGLFLIMPKNRKIGWNNSLALAVPVIALFLAAAGCERAGIFPASKIFERFESIGSFGTGAGQFNKPRSVAVDGAGIVHVADMTGRIQRFDARGRYLGAWQAPDVLQGRPKGMGVDKEGHLMLVEPHYQRVTHFDSGGKPLFTWGRSGKAAGELAFPRAIIADSSGNFFVCEYLDVQRIQKFDARRNFLKAWGAEGSGTSQFRRPEGLGVDRENHVYVADSCNHRIQKFSADGTFLSEFGSAGTGLGRLNYPYDVKTDSLGRIYVCEFGNSRIQVFSPQGVAIEIIGGAGAGDWQFRNPWGIALDADENLFVADSMNHRIAKLVRRGKAAQ